MANMQQRRTCRQPAPQPHSHAVNQRRSRTCPCKPRLSVLLPLLLSVTWRACGALRASVMPYFSSRLALSFCDKQLKLNKCPLSGGW